MAFTSAPRDAEIYIGSLLRKASSAASTDLAATELATILNDTAAGTDKLREQSEVGAGEKLWTDVVVPILT